MNIQKTGSNITCDFDNILDFLDYVIDVPDDNYSKTADDDDDWSGGSYEDAVRQARTGNPELVNDFFNGANIINNDSNTQGIAEIRDVTGEYFDVGDFLSGEPEVFRRNELELNKKVINVYADPSMSCGITASAIKNRGCAIVALCDKLEQDGFIVDLKIAQNHEYDCKNIALNIGINTTPLDIDTFAFIVANPLFLRRLFLSLLEKLFNKSGCGDYGCGVDDRPKVTAPCFCFVNSWCKDFNKANYKTLGNTKKHIENMIEQYNQNPQSVVFG